MTRQKNTYRTPIGEISAYTKGEARAIVKAQTGHKIPHGNRFALIQTNPAACEATTGTEILPVVSGRD